MERYFCKCLNIIVNVNSKETRESIGRDLIQTALLDEVENIDPFFAGKLLDVRLAVSGVEVSQSVLAKERFYGDWLVSTCLNCGLDTHAMHAAKGADRVFLSVDIPYGIDVLQRIRESSTYSTFLQLNLMETANRSKNNRSYFTQSSMIESTEKIHNLCKKLIQAEEEAKNERLRVFAEKENQGFREYKMKGNRDKESLLRTMREFVNTNASMSTFSESYFGSSSMEARDVTTDLPKFKVPTLMFAGKKKDNSENTRDCMSQSLPNYRSQNLSESINNHMNQKLGKCVLQKKHSSDNDDILFDMEGYHNEKDCEPFFESDDESSGDATSLESSGGFSATSSRGIPMSAGNRDNVKPGDRVYATSLPVPVPLFNNSRYSYDPESDDEMKTAPSLTKLAASFKVVTKSMQDSTGMFGDLPPRRTEQKNETLSVCTEYFPLKSSS